MGGGNVYGNNIYKANSNINTAATHMGIVESGMTDTVFIKIKESPVGGYLKATKNRISSTGLSNDISKGFVFVTEDGTEIYEPIVNSATAIIGSEENTIVATINAKGQNGANVQKYYYSIDNGAYVETTENVYVFTGVQAYKTHTIKIYVRDNNNAISQVSEIVTSVITNNVTPTMTVDKEPIIIDGEEWYPYGTKLTINYANDMTDLTAYYKYTDERNGNEGSWTNYSTNPTYSTTLNYSVTYMAKIANKSGNETEVVSKTFKVMPCATGSPGTSYYNEYYGTIYPVQVTGTTSGNIWGTDIYYFISNINTAATHMGLVEPGQTNIVYVKIVKAPTGGYKGTLRNNVTTGSGISDTNNGFMFVDKDGNEIKVPTISSVAVTSGENTITVTVTPGEYDANIVKYYYSIDGSAYAESESNIHTFDVKYSGNRLIKIYVEYSDGKVTPHKVIYRKKSSSNSNYNSKCRARNV